MKISLQKEIDSIDKWEGLTASGIVTQIIGLLIESIGPVVHLGELCYIYNKQGEAIPSEVVGFKDGKVLLMSLGELTHIAPGSEVFPTHKVHAIAVSESMCGRILDALGNPIDGKGPIKVEKYYPVMAIPPRPLERKLITEVLETGIKAIDATCTFGQGQRIGVFSSAGLGKSTLMGMVAKRSKSDVNVIALIGERGREVKEFIERDLGVEGLARSVIVVVTSDEAALLRTKGAHTAAAIAEYFRDLGKNVIFLMDSISRYSMALREIGLAVGEPPATRGFTPSVFAMLPKLLERAGNSDKGTITGIYTILVDGDDFNDPIAEIVRSILDGHILLSRDLASGNHYPAINVLESLSRVMVSIVSPEHYELAGRLRDIMQTYKEAADLIDVGAYVVGSNPKIDESITLMNAIRNFLKQSINEFYSLNDTINLLKEIVKPY
jgi:flagellum-specific ATP synthase